MFARDNILNFGVGKSKCENHEISRTLREKKNNMYQQILMEYTDKYAFSGE